MIPGTDERRLRSRTSAHAIFNISGQCWHCSVFEKYQNMYIYIYTVYTSLTQSFAFSWLLPLLTIIQSRRSEVIIFHTNPYGRPKKRITWSWMSWLDPGNSCKFNDWWTSWSKTVCRHLPPDPPLDHPYLGLSQDWGRPKIAKFDGEINSWTNPRVWVGCPAPLILQTICSWSEFFISHLISCVCEMFVTDPQWIISRCVL